MEILQFACHLDFTWNQILVSSNRQQMSILALLEVLNFDFGEFEPFFKSQICQNAKSRVCEIVKIAIFEIQILPKLISHKIEWQIDYCIVDFNFTFWKFLEHSLFFRRKLICYLSLSGYKLQTYNKCHYQTPANCIPIGVIYGVCFKNLFNILLVIYKVHHLY